MARAIVEADADATDAGATPAP